MKKGKSHQNLRKSGHGGRKTTERVKLYRNLKKSIWGIAGGINYVKSH